MRKIAAVKKIKWFSSLSQNLPVIQSFLSKIQGRMRFPSLNPWDLSVRGFEKKGRKKPSPSFPFLSFLCVFTWKQSKGSWLQEKKRHPLMKLKIPQFSTILGPLYLAPTTKKSSGLSFSSNHAYPPLLDPSSVSTETSKRDLMKWLIGIKLIAWLHTSEPKSMILQRRTNSERFSRYPWKVGPWSVTRDGGAHLCNADCWIGSATIEDALHKHFSDDLSHPSRALKMVRLKLTELPILPALEGRIIWGSWDAGIENPR